jgi:hypothetical protein
MSIRNRRGRDFRPEARPRREPGEAILSRLSRCAKHHGTAIVPTESSAQLTLHLVSAVRRGFAPLQACPNGLAQQFQESFVRRRRSRPLLYWRQLPEWPRGLPPQGTKDDMK